MVINVKVYLRKLIFICIVTILSITTYLNTTQFRGTYRHYNKNLEHNLKNLSSENPINLVILTVSGDKNYLTRDLKSIYYSNNIMHLLVLSGSNISILIMFIELFKKRYAINNVVFKNFVIFNYFVFTNYQHPLARAYLFMTVVDIVQTSGLKISLLRKTLILLSLSSIVFLYLNFSLSFLLSVYFSICILFFQKLTINYNTIVRYLVFNTCMTVCSIPLMYVFGYFSILKSLLSNLVTGFSYDFIVLASYIVYFGYLIIPEDITYLLLATIEQYIQILRAMSYMNFDSIIYFNE